MTKKDLTIRNVDENEFMDIRRFVAKIGGLENYPAHFYRIMLRYFGDTCFVTEDIDHNIIGFVLGMQSQRHKNTYFLWQIGVNPDYQGQGIGSLLLRMVENQIQQLGGSRIEVTIDPKNIPSRKLFEKAGYQNISSQVGETIEKNGVTAVKDYYSPGRHFIVCDKKLPQKQ